MYIPFSFFGGACLNSGATFYYYNSGSTIDTFSYSSLCNSVTISQELSPSQSIEICSSTTPSGVNATTVLVDAPWNVTGSCNELFAGVYRISATSSPIGSSKNVYYSYYGRLPNNTFFLDDGLIVGTGTQTVDVISYCVPQITNYEFSNVPTITYLNPANSAATDNRSADLYKNKTKIIRFDSSNALSASAATYRYLDAGNNIKDFTQPSLIGINNRRYVYELVSNTIPQKYNGIGNSLIVAGIADGVDTIQSSSCYTYSLYSESGSATFNYLDCSNVSQSITISAGFPLTEICAKANTITLPTISSLNRIDVEVISPCS